MLRIAGLGYIEVGMCTACRTPNHLFVSSILSPDQPPACMSCLIGASMRASYSETNYSVDPLYNTSATEFPVLQSQDVCEGCLRPELPDDPRWKFEQAFLADQTTVATVHNSCVTGHCSDCNTEYATHNRRPWRSFELLSAPVSVISMNEFVSFTNIEGNLYCNVCTENHYIENGGEEMFSYCNNCENTIHRNRMLYFDGTNYCEPCYDDNVYRCDDCDEEYWDGSGHDCEEEGSDIIHSYSYKPSPQFFGSGRYHLGFELEVEARDESRYFGAGITQEILGGRAYMKDDGSLSDGFEIVTHPHTLAEYQQNFDWKFLSKLQRHGFRSWNTSTCGLHVHVSRCAFGELRDPWNSRITSAERSRLILRKQSHELRFMKLIYDNQRQVERIAGRGGNHYATFEDKGKLVSKIKFGEQSNGRYSAVNTENDSTIEVRVFRGSLRKERVLSAIEFVTASVEYTRNLKVTSKNHALSWLGLSSYVMNNINEYPNLATIMSESFANESVSEQEEN